MPNTEATEADMRKSLIVCCDGTGQSSTSGKPVVPTNVTRFAQALKTSIPSTREDYPPYTKNPEIPQIVLYQTGIGSTEVTAISQTIAREHPTLPLRTYSNSYSSIFTESFGAGIDAHILEAYTFFSNNFETGDELFLFGFSRGAFTARAIASLICNVRFSLPSCVTRASL